MRYISYIVAILYCNSCFAQGETKLINSFYTLLNKDFVSIYDCNQVFDRSTLELEDYIFLNQCTKTKKEGDCVSIAKERKSRWSSYESVFFAEIKRQKDVLTQGELDDQRKINIKIKKVNEVAQVVFSNNKRITFTFDVLGGLMRIIDIYLPDGNSILNGIDGSEGHALKLFAVARDEDGYVNIRSGKDQQSTVLAKVVDKDVFLCTPNYEESWWAIETKNKQKGYIHKSRIKLFIDLPAGEQTDLQDSCKNFYRR